MEGPLPDLAIRPESGLGLWELSRSLPSTPEAVRAHLMECTGWLGGRGRDLETIGGFELVLAEVLNNVVEHAYGEKPDGEIQVTVVDWADRVYCQVLDQGAQMPGLTLPEGKAAHVDTAFEDLPEGGFGWFLIKELTHDLGYSRVEGENRLSFAFAETS